MSALRRLVCSAALVAAAADRVHADVLIVDSSGRGEYVEIQEAVHAAANGDTLLVRPGTYAGFAITHKSLDLVSEGGRQIDVVGDVVVRDLAPGHEVSLAHLTLTGPGTQRLQIGNCKGPVRIRSCVVLDGAPAAWVWGSDDVAFVDCTFAGRNGAPGGGAGGDGLYADASEVALHGCLVTGGEGGDGYDGDSCFGGGCTDGGYGGDGLTSSGSFVYASDCHLEGRPGGEGGIVNGYCDCDDGSDGASVVGYSGSTIVLLDCSTVGQVIGDVEQLPGRARRIELPALATELEAHTLLCHGLPGDLVRIHAAPRGSFLFVPTQRGVDLLGERFAGDAAAIAGPATLGSLHVATIQAEIPASGVLGVPLRALGLEPDELARTHHVQALFTEGTGRSTWSNVAVTEILAGAAFVVDCPAAECPAPGVVHVDDDAPGDPGPGDTSVGDPDEDGSAEHPFDSILEALVTVAEGGEIVVQDGLYTGPANTNLGFLGRGVRLRSANGPEACVLDAQGAANVLRFLEGEPAGTLVDGLTLTGATAGAVSIAGSSPTIDRCRIVGNSTTGAAAGIRVESGSPRITRCTISGNSAGSGAGGIGVSESGPGGVLVRSCTITDNVAQNAGGVQTHAQLVLLESCTIARNSGVGAQVVSNSSGPPEGLRVRNCIFWGNEIASLRRYFGNLYVDYSDIEGGEAGILGQGNVFWGVGNLDVDPLFVDPDAGDLHLLADSPCIDAGDPAFVPEPGETDVDGDTRALDGAIDMGSDETFRDCNSNGLPDAEEGLYVSSPVYSPIGTGQATAFRIASPPPAQGPVLLELWASADLGDQNERITIRVNNMQFGSVFSLGAHDCPISEDRTTLVIPAAGFNAAVSGGDAVITLLPSSTVDPAGCTSWASYLYLSVLYDGDCDGNGVLDSCEIAAGTATDANGNGVPDACE